MTQQHFFVGTYSSEDERGLARLSFDAATGWRLGARVVDVENASFAARDEQRGLHYMLDERDSGAVTVCERTEDGGWRKLSTASTGGAMPCHVALHPSGTALAVANYGSGEVAVHRISADGTIEGAPVVAPNQGSGPVKERQTGPHAHCVRFMDGFVYSTDLGTDEVLCRAYDADAHVLGERQVAFKLPGGQGPRHIVFHPRLPLAYVLTELGSEIFVLQRNPDGRLVEVERVSSLPPGFDGESLGGHLEIDDAAERLYASNRGHDSIATFAVDGEGKLAFMSAASSGGMHPRHFLLWNGHVIVAHEKGNRITVLTLDADRCAGACVKSLPIARPAFIGVC